MSESEYPEIQVTNNLENSVTVYDAFDKQNNGLVAYTKLGTIPSGKTQKVQTLRLLSALVVSTNVEVNEKTYQNFPVKKIVVMPLLIDSDKNKKHVVTTDDFNIMKRMLTFIQLTQSNPTAVLAKGFNSAVKSGSSKGGSLINSVNDFFKSHQETKGCTLEAWVMITNWMNNYVSPWQGYYYLYNVPSTESLSTSGDSAEIKLIATMKVNGTGGNQNCANLTMTETKKSYTLSFVPAKTTTDTNKKYQPGMLSCTNVDLTPAWAVKNDKTKIGTCASGTINNIKVYGTNEKLSLPKHVNDNKESKRNYVNMVESIIQTIWNMAIGMWGIKQLQAKLKAAKTPQEKEKVKEKYGNDVQQQIEKQEKSAAQMEKEIVQNQLDEQTDQIEDLLNITPSDPEMEGLAGKIDEAQEKLNIDNFKEIGKQVDGFQTEIQEIHKKTVSQFQDQEKADYEVAEKNTDDFKELQEEYPDFKFGEDVLEAV